MTTLFLKSWYIYPGICLLFCLVTTTSALSEEKISNDSLRVLVQTSQDIQSSDPLRAISLATEALSENVAKRLPALLPDVHMTLADSYYDLTRIDSALLHYQKAIKIAKKRNAPKSLCRGINGLGNCYYFTGDIENAWKYYEEALQIAIDSDITDKIPALYNNLGNILMDQDSDQKALEYYKKALKFTSKPLFNAHFYNNIGLCYQKINNLDTALAWYEKSKNIYNQLGEKGYSLTPMYNIALIQFDKEEYDNALNSYLNMVDECIELGLKEDLIFIYNRLGLIYNIQGKHKRALHFHNKCIDLAKKTNHRHTSTYFVDIANTYDSLEEYDKALFYIKKHEALKDSLNSIEKEKAISELITRYETKEKTIKIARLEAEKEKLTMKAKQEAFVRNSVIIVALLMFILILIFIFLYRKKLTIERHLALHLEESQKRREAEQMHQNEINLMKVGIQAQENEKKRIASHLHDSVAGTLAGIKQSLSSLSPNSFMDQEISLALKYIDNAYLEVSTLSNHLSHLPSIDKNFIVFLRKYCQDISELNHIHISFLAIEEEELKGLDHKVKQELFRVFQEAFNNIIKHARANHVAVHISLKDKMLEVIIKDNGVGFNISDNNGLGLKNLQARVEFINGSLKLNTTPGQGTEILVVIPLNLTAHKA